MWVGRQTHLETFIDFVSLLSGSTSTRQSASPHAVLITDDLAIKQFIRLPYDTERENFVPFLKRGIVKFRTTIDLTLQRPPAGLSAEQGDLIMMVIS